MFILMDNQNVKVDKKKKKICLDETFKKFLSV